ncbi:MAG: hypothetical protein QOH25_844 [Acidobacteriota bacterium]|jgi:O-antigen ligase|nr:hypothetical protein [Acidobacteriota bacterium]
MSYKSTPFDYEPITRRGHKALEERELEEGFAAAGRERSHHVSSVDETDEWPVRDREVDDRTRDDLPWQGEDAGGVLKASARSTGKSTEKKEGWTSRRGHALSFAGLFLFTLVLYFRPYELFESLSGLNSLAFWIAVATLVAFVPTQLGLEGTLTVRPREVNLILWLALIGLVGVPLAISPAEAWDNFIQFLKVVVMFVVMVNVIKTEQRLKALIFLGLAAGCLVSVAALNDYRLGQLKLAGSRVLGIIGGMFENPNDMALFLVMMVPLSVAMLVTARGMTRKIIYGACALVMIAANLVTFSRGGFIGLVCVLLVLAWKFGRRHRLGVMLCSILCGAFMLILLPGALVERLASTYGTGGSDESALASAVSRQALLLRSIWMSLRHPLLGIGMGNFHTVSIHEQVSHNAYTQVSAELGIPALILYVMLMWTALRRLRQIERETLGARHKAHFYYLAIGLQASLIGYIVSSFFASVAFLYYLYYPVGYAVCLHFMYKSSQAKEAAVALGTKGRTVKETGKDIPSHALP